MLGTKIITSLMGSIGSKLIIGGAKEVYRNRREAKIRRELEAKISFASRGFLATLMLYIIGFIICFSIMKGGIWGILLVLIGYFGHFNNLNEAKQYVSTTREMSLSIISVVGLVITYFLL